MHLSSPPRPAALASAVTPGDQRRDSASDGVSSSEKEAERREGKQATYSNERSSDRMLERFSELWGDSGGLQGYLPSDCGAEERQHGDADPEEDEEGDFSRYCRAFYREQERQQQRLLQGPVDELERLRRPLEEVLEGVSQMERDGARLQTSKEEVRRCTAGVHRACRHLLQEQSQLQASSYLWKYELLGTRARAVVRSAVVQTLEACQANVEKRLRERREAAVARRSSSFAADAQRDSSSEKEAREREPEPAFDPALFHVSFRVAGAPLKPLTTLLVERQRQGNPEAYARTIEDIQERLLFRADAFIERHIRSYPAAPTELVAFIFSSLGFPSPARSLPLPDSSLSPASSVFFPVRAALHLATLLRQTVSAEAFGSLCGAALEASCAALSRACLSLEHAVHNGFSPKSCLPPATLEAVQNSATFSSSASPSSLTSSASPDTSPLSSAASASVNLPFHVFLRQLCEARCDAAAGEAGSRLRTARPHPREEDLSPDGEVFSALWAELICTLFLLKHLTVLHSFLDSFRDGDFSPVCRKICFPRMLFAGSRLASAGASGSAGNEGGCEVSPETREKKSEEEGGRKMRFALLSWLFRPEAQEETLDIREVLREETKRRLDGLLATLVAAFALPVEKRLAQLPVAGRLQHEDTANASFVHEQQLKETLEEFQRNLQDQLPAVLLLAILFFDMGEQEGTREQGEGEQEEGEQEEGGRKVHGEMARKWRQREEVLDSMEFLIQPLFSGILSAYKQLGSAVETHVSAETRKAIGWRSAEDLRQSLLLPACAVAFSAAQQFQLSLSPYPK